MKLLYIILLSYPFLLTAQGKQRIIKGQVVDNETKAPVSLVSIRYNKNPETEITLTDINGSFIIKIPENTKELYVSHIAYEPVKIQLNGKRNKNLKIFLHPKMFFLNEITIQKEALSSAKSIVQKVALQLKNNIISTPYLAKAHFVTYRKKNNKYVFFAETMAEHLNDAYSETGNSYCITKPIEYRISDQGFSFTSINSYKFPNTQGISFRYNQILLPVIFYNAFFYEIKDTLITHGQKHLLINYKINNKVASKMWNNPNNILFYPKYYQYGNILINLETYAVCKITNRGSITYLGKTNSEHISTYTFKNINNIYYLSETIITHTYNEKSPNTGYYDSFTNRLKATFSNFNTKPISNRQIEKNFNCKIKILNHNGNEYRYFVHLPAPKEKISKYNPNFWKTQALPDNWKQIKSDIKMLSGLSIEQQFEKNNEYLISKEKFRKLRKLADKETRKTMSRKYKYLSENNFFID